MFSTLRREDLAAAVRFSQTVLTLAILVDGRGEPRDAGPRPGDDRHRRARLRRRGTGALYLDLFRLMLLTPILFAASIALGEVLVAERHFVYYALAPILYNAGIVAGTLLFHSTMGIRAAALGAVFGACLHLGIRIVGITRTPVRLRLRLDLRMPALRVHPADDPQDAERADRAAHVPVLHRDRDRRSPPAACPR